MLLTCLKCGNQTPCGYSTAVHDMECVCGIHHSTPIVVDAGVQPSLRLAERTRARAFRAAGVVSNIGGTALMIASFGVLFPLFGFVGAVVGAYQLIAFHGAKGRYSGRQSAIAAIIVGLILGTVGSSIWYGKWLERHQRELASRQSGAKSDLRNLLRAQRLHHAIEGRYGTFEECAYVAKDGTYTIHLAADELSPGIGGAEPLPDEVKVFVFQNKFQAAAVTNLDDDETLDVWVIDQTGKLRNHSNDIKN